MEIELYCQKSTLFLYPPSGGGGGDLVASISTMAKVDTIGKTFSNGIRICPILIDYFVVSKYKIIELSIETTHLFENRVL